MNDRKANGAVQYLDVQTACRAPLCSGPPVTRLALLNQLLGQIR